MMDKWAIRPDPSPFDPRRHVLLVKGDMKDVSAILKRFGALCGRPAATKTSEGFNFSLLLHGMTQVGIEKMSAALNDMSGAPASASLPGRQVTPPPPLTPPPMGLPPMPSLPPAPAEPAKFSGPVAFEAPAPLGPPPVTPPPLAPPPATPLPAALPPLAPPPATPLPTSLPPLAPPPVAPPVVAPAALSLGEPPMDKSALPTDESQLKAAPELAPPAITPPPLEPPLAPPAVAPPAAELPTAPAPPPLPAPPIPTQPLTPLPTPLPAAPVPLPALSEPAPAAAPQPAKPMWGLAMPLGAEMTFDTLLVGPYNRFAHAAATSVVGSPGSMYNPLFLYGASGVGKTHMAHALAHGLATSMTPKGLVVTSGARLSRAVTLALADKKFKDVETWLSERKAIIVDDIHLLAVTEANRASLARVFELFFSKGLQVVFTSIYPPRALGALEEALKISLGKGWSVDLKMPNPNAQLQLLQGYLDKNGLPIEKETAKMFLERVGPSGPGEWKRWATRLRTMARIIQASGHDPRIDDILPVLFDPGAVAAGGAEFPKPAELEAARAYRPPAPAASALALAVFVPKGHENFGPWALMRFFEAARQFQITQTYRSVVLETYDAGQPFGVPFQIGEVCQRAGAQAALIVGPPGDSGLAGRAAEFTHAVRHVLESGDVSTGWIPHTGTQAPHNFLRAHLDFLAGLA